jgi:hypothetical protein
MDIVERLRREEDRLDDEAADEIERLRKRVNLLEGYLRGALNVVENFAHCDTTDARQALGEKK